MALATALKPAYTEPPPEPTPSDGNFKTNPALDAMLVAKEPPPVTEPIVSEEAKAREAELFAAGKRASEAIQQSRKEIEALGGPPKLVSVPDAPVAKHTNPIEAFGSTASILAMVGSLATRRPLMHALNNAAGVLEAYKANDTQRANEEFARWKANTENAMKIHEYQSSSYQQALAQIQTKGKLAADEVQVLASSYGDPVMKELAKAQRYAEMEDYAMKRNEMFLKLQGSYADIGAMQQREELVQELINTPEYAAMTPNQKAAKINEIRNPSKASTQGFAVKDAGSLLLPDGTKTTGFLDPNTKQLMIHDPVSGEYVPAPPGTQRVSVNAGGPLTAAQWQKLNLDIQSEENSLKQLNKYMTLMKDVPSGLQRWSTDWSGRLKTFFGNQVNAEEFKLKTAEAKIQALLGMFRESVVGPGVMTEYDAIRVLKALGDEPTSALQNPQVLNAVITDIYNSKAQRLDVLRKDRDRNAPYFDGNAVSRPTPAATPTAPAAPAEPARFTPTDAGPGPTTPGALPLPKELAPGTPDRKAYDAQKGATIEWTDDVTGQVGYYRIEGNQMVPVPKPTGPAGGPLESLSPSQSTALASPVTTPAPRVKPEPPAVTSPQKSAGAMVNAPPTAQPPRVNPNKRVEFGVPLEVMGLQTAEPQTAAQRAITQNLPRDSSETLAASRRDVQPEGRPVSDIEQRRREGASRFDKLLGRSKTERGKPKRYKLSRDADGSTIVEVLP